MRKRKVVLHSGDYCFGGSNLEIYTLLGSCVSIALWNEQKRVGGLCHFALPASPVGDRSLNPRFADSCMKLFCQSARRYHLPIQTFQAKIFGGGNMYERLPGLIEGEDDSRGVGERNVLAAYNLIMQHDIKLKVADVGEFGYRNIIFDVQTGDVWVRYRPVEERKTERFYRTSLKQSQRSLVSKRPRELTNC